MPYRTTATLAVALWTSMSTQAAPQYRVEMLPDLDGGAAFNAVGINNRGDIAGYSENSSGSRAFVYNKNGFNFLPQGSNSSIPVDINNRGQVLYNANTAGGQTEPFLYGPKGAFNINPDPGSWGMGRALSSSGQAVGTIGDKNFYYDGKTSQYVDFDLEDARAAFVTGVNRNGVIVGRATVSGEATRGFIYSQGRASLLDGLSDAYAINDNGQILSVDGGGYLLRHSDGSKSYLGFSAYGSTSLNQRGWVVGNTVVDGALHAFVYRDDESTDLNRLIAGPDASRWTLTSAADINERGQIIGTGLFDGQRVSFVATPVPEPGRWALMLCGVGVIGVALRRRNSGMASR